MVASCISVWVFEKWWRDEVWLLELLFFHSCSSARADCLLGLTSSTAGCPLAILAGSPRVGETGRWPSVVTIVMTASIYWDIDFQLVLCCRCLCFFTVYHQNTAYYVYLDQRVVVSSCFSLHVFFNFISVVKIYWSCRICLVWSQL